MTNKKKALLDEKKQQKENKSAYTSALWNGKSLGSF